MQSPPYQEDLAFIHEAGFSDVARAAARMVEDLVQPPSLVVDLGCGGGTLLAFLSKRGFTGTGSDISPSMVALAKRQAPNCNFHVADAAHADIPSCLAVTAVGEIVSHVAAAHGDAAVTNLFKRARAALPEGGIFLFDAATPGRASNGPTRAQRSGRNWRVEAHSEEQSGWLTRSIDTWRRQPNGDELHRREVHRLRLLEPTWIGQQLEACGFSVQVLGGYDDFGFVEGWDGFLARPVALK